MRDFLARETFDTAQHNGFAAARRQIFEGGVKAAQRIARYHGAIRAGDIGGGADGIEIRHGIDRHHTLAVDAIDQKIARGCEDERFGAFGNFGFACGQHLGIDLLTDIFQVGLVAPVLVQEMHQHRLQRQNFTYKPFLRFGRSHGCIRTRWFLACPFNFGCLVHPRPVARLFGVECATTPIGQGRAPEVLVRRERFFQGATLLLRKQKGGGLLRRLRASC